MTWSKAWLLVGETAKLCFADALSVVWIGGSLKDPQIKYSIFTSSVTSCGTPMHLEICIDDVLLDV